MKTEFEVKITNQIPDSALSEPPFIFVWKMDCGFDFLSAESVSYNDKYFLKSVEPFLKLPV